MDINWEQLTWKRGRRQLVASPRDFVVKVDVTASRYLTFSVCSFSSFLIALSYFYFHPGTILIACTQHCKTHRHRSDFLFFLNPFNSSQVDPVSSSVPPFKWWVKFLIYPTCFHCYDSFLYFLRKIIAINIGKRSEWSYTSDRVYRNIEKSIRDLMKSSSTMIKAIEERKWIFLFTRALQNTLLRFYGYARARYKLSSGFLRYDCTSRQAFTFLLLSTAEPSTPSRIPKK